jgi:hypothetical protein
MPYKPQKTTYADYKTFGWGFGSDKSKAQFRDAQIKAYHKRAGMKAASSIYSIRAKQKKREAGASVARQLAKWAQEGIGLGDLSKDEWQFINMYKQITGDPPPIFENPFMIERMGKMLDRAFDVGTVAVGAGVATQAVKAGLKGTQLATSQLARAQTKKAVKAAVRRRMRELARKRTVKQALKGGTKGVAKAGGKALEYEYKAAAVREIGGSLAKGFKQATGGR